MKAKPSTYRICCEKKDFEFDTYGFLDLFIIVCGTDFIDRGKVTNFGGRHYGFCEYAYKIHLESLK